jgi:hypothetical protein
VFRVFPLARQWTGLLGSSSLAPGTISFHVVTVTDKKILLMCLDGFAKGDCDVKAICYDRERDSPPQPARSSATISNATRNGGHIARGASASFARRLSPSTLLRAIVVVDMLVVVRQPVRSFTLKQQGKAHTFKAVTRTCAPI